MDRYWKGPNEKLRIYLKMVGNLEGTGGKDLERNLRRYWKGLGNELGKDILLKILLISFLSSL